MERRALQGAIGLSDHDDVDAAGQGGGVKAPIELFDLDEHLPGQLPHVVHGLTGLDRKTDCEIVMKQEYDIFQSFRANLAHSSLTFSPSAY